MHKSTYQKDVKNKTYRENRSWAKKLVMRLPNPYHKSGPDDYDLYNVGSKSKTRSRRGTRRSR
jgi:hypothetical protein